MPTCSCLLLAFRDGCANEAGRSLNNCASRAPSTISAAKQKKPRHYSVAAVYFSASSYLKLSHITPPQEYLSISDAPKLGCREVYVESIPLDAQCR